MADFARETLREARTFADKGEWRLAIQRCELIRSRTRVSESILIETFGILGCGHVELGQYEEALSFLKRASPTPVTIAAAQRCYHELELSGDPRAVFERDAERQVRRKKRLLAGAIAAVLALPVLGCCGWVAYVAGDGYLTVSDIMRESQAGYGEGMQAGPSSSLEGCVDQAIERQVRCGADAPQDEPCRIRVMGFRTGCFEHAPYDEEFCASLPPATADGDPLVERCDGRAEPARAACLEATRHARGFCESPLHGQESVEEF